MPLIVKWCEPTVEMSTWRSRHVRYSVIDFDRAKIFSVTPAGAGPESQKQHSLHSSTQPLHEAYLTIQDIVVMVIYFVQLKTDHPSNYFKTQTQFNFTYALTVDYKPPFAMLNLIPKSASGPPGLCDAVSMMPPSVLYLRITQDTAGVDIIPFWATITLATWHEQSTCLLSLWVSLSHMHRCLHNNLLMWAESG